MCLGFRTLRLFIGFWGGPKNCLSPKICIKYLTCLSYLQLTCLANFDSKKYILKPKFLTYILINFLVLTLQCAETLILYAFGPWKKNKNKLSKVGYFSKIEGIFSKYCHKQLTYLSIIFLVRTLQCAVLFGPMKKWKK